MARLLVFFLFLATSVQAADPMRPFDRADIPNTAPRYVLSAVVWRAVSPSAVINDTAYVVGDVVGPYRITRIRERSVVLQRGKQTLVLPLSQDDHP